MTKTPATPADRINSQDPTHYMNPGSVVTGCGQSVYAVYSVSDDPAAVTCTQGRCAEAIEENRKRSGCTATTWTAQHAFESDPIELDPEGYDEYERCEKSADDPIHRVDPVHFDLQFGTPPPCGDAEPWDAKTTDRDKVTCHMCVAHLDAKAVLRPLGAVTFTVTREGALETIGSCAAGGALTGKALGAFTAGDYPTAQALAEEQVRSQQVDDEEDAPTAPERTDDDVRWSAYSVALPTPDVAEYAKVVAEFCTSPYAAGRQRALDGFRRTTRMIWRWRHTAAKVDRFAYRVARAELHGFAARVRAYDALTQVWVTEQAERMRSEAMAMTSPKVGA